jgi:hypothetical protein
VLTLCLTDPFVSVRIIFSVQPQKQLIKLKNVHQRIDDKSTQLLAARKNYYINCDYVNYSFVLTKAKKQSKWQFLTNIELRA